MTVRLDKGVSAGAARIAALVRVTCFARGLGRAVAGHAAKQPLAILVVEDATCRAFDLRGRELDRARVDALCPGAWAAFLAAGDS